MDAEALRIHDRIVEASALLDWVERGAVPAQAVQPTLAALRDELCDLSTGTADVEAADAACGVVACIDEVLEARFDYAARGAA